MPREAITILDGERNAIATAKVDVGATCYSGPARLDQMPEKLRALFEEYEEVVNDQMFGLLDAIEGRIEGMAFLVLFDDGREARAEDLQIFPKAGTISFKTTEPATVGEGRSA